MKTQVCPSCHGVPPHCAVAFFNTGEDWTKHYHGKVTIVCKTCNGSGAVTQDAAARYHEGQTHRALRIGRGETLFAAAKRLGVSTPQLSAYELYGVALPTKEAKP